MLWFKIYFGRNFPLSQIMAMNLRQRIKKIQPVSIFKPKKLHHTILINCLLTLHVYFFFQVHATARTRGFISTWFQDLAGNKPLTVLAKKVSVHLHVHAICHMPCHNDQFDLNFLILS